jgi:hypothetical protein
VELGFEKPWKTDHLGVMAELEASCSALLPSMWDSALRRLNTAQRIILSTTYQPGKLPKLYDHKLRSGEKHQR